MHALRRDQDGAMMVMGTYMAVFAVALLYYLVGIGETIAHRELLQDASDYAAFDGAVIMAQGMNLIALFNIIGAALMAVLIALKVIEGLAAIVWVIGEGLCVIPPTAAVGCPIAEVANTVKTTAKDTHDALKPVIHGALQGLNGASDAVAYTWGGATALRASASTMEEYNVDLAVVLPSAVLGLPVEDDEVSEICKRGALLITDVVVAPFAGMPDVVQDGISEGMADTVESSRSYFCEDLRDNMAPKKMKEDDTELGEEIFQVRGLAYKESDLALREKPVALAAWGHEAEARNEWMSDMAKLSSFGFAQAEFYYDAEDGEGKDEWLWHMNWRARLRRFRMPDSSLFDNCAVCGSLPGGDLINNAIAH